MRLHRFYISGSTELKHKFWLHDERLLHQWNKVLRFKAGQEVILFDGATHDRLYKIDKLVDSEAHLIHITDFARQLPKKNIYLIWALLKKDKDDWILQKCTELGVSHFVPLLAERSEKTGFNHERAEKIVIEASEQCGRSDIPNVREPVTLTTVINELQPKVQLIVADQSGGDILPSSNDIGIFVGPEGGWTEVEDRVLRQI